MSVNMSIDNASPSLMSKWNGWPLHMYVAKDEGNPLRCPATGCRKKWLKREGDPRLAMAEHWGSAPLTHTTDIHHQILIQMHQLSRCLKCKTDFKLPNSDLPDSRALFKHHRDTHPDEKDVSKIKGFVVHVRKYSDGLARDTQEEKDYCKKTWKIVYEYMLFHLYADEAPERLLNDFLALSGHEYTYRMPKEEFLRLLTDDEKRYLPVHPNNFLNDMQRQGPWLSRAEFPVLKAEFREYYSEGKI